MPPPPPPPTTDLRQTLLTHLDKLSDRSTFQTSSAHLTTLAHTLPPDQLPTFLSTLMTASSSSSSSTAVKLHSLSLITLLASTHSASVSVFLPKLLTFLLSLLRDPSSSVRNAVSSPASSFSSLRPDIVLPSLLHSLSSDHHPSSQVACCLAIKQSILAVDWAGTTANPTSSSPLDCERDLLLRKTKQPLLAVDCAGTSTVDLLLLLRKVLSKALKLVKLEGFGKARAGLMGVIASAVGAGGGVVISGSYEARISLLDNVVSSGVHMLSCCDDWGARKGGAELLQVVADVGELQLLTNFKPFVVASLESRRFDKVKITREVMMKAWETWKAIPGDPDEVSPLPRSNSSTSKDNGGGAGSPPLPRKSSFAASEAYKPKQTLTKSRSSLSNGPTEFNSPSVSSSNQDNRRCVTPQRKQTLSKSRSSLSDDSSITDSSSVTKSSCDFGFETPDSRKQMSKSRSSLPDHLSKSMRMPSKTYGEKSRTSLDYKIEVAVPSVSSSRFESEDETESRDKTMEVTTSSSGRTSCGEVIQETGFRCRSNGTRVSPIVREVEVHGLDARGRQYEEVGENRAESEELSLIRNQLRQIEKQQSDLLHLVQRFMGKSQNGIDSLETRVSGLERALDVISHDLAVQTGRFPNSGSAGSTCCPSTEFLSPKFWRRTEGKSSNCKPSYSGNSPNKETSPEALQKDGSSADSWGSVKGVNHITQTGRTWSPKSFDATSPTAFTAPVVRGA
ncbi:hypothetical protein vseg_002115 [Gypsophila vaccaria]